MKPEHSRFPETAECECAVSSISVKADPGSALRGRHIINDAGAKTYSVSIINNQQTMCTISTAHLLYICCIFTVYSCICAVYLLYIYLLRIYNILVVYLWYSCNIFAVYFRYSWNTFTVYLQYIWGIYEVLLPLQAAGQPDVETFPLTSAESFPGCTGREASTTTTTRHM